MKKISALLIAVVMIMAMSTTAFAADNTYTGSGNDNADNFAGLSANPQTIPLTKGIVFFNANGSDVYEPNVTFNYVVSPASIAADGSDATVTDNQSPAVQRNVYPGPTGGVTGTTISFSASNAIKGTAADGAEVEETGNLGLVISEFDKPGIYRYIITESVTAPATGSTDSENLQAAGLAARDSAYDNTRYLDVYIHYVDDDSDPTTPEVLQMYGAVIFKTTESSGDEGEDDITTTTKKTTGFEPNPTADGSITYANDPNVDKYYTYDFTVKKTVSGSMADKTHNFPFYVSISNTITGAKYTYFDDPGTGSGAAETIAAAAINKGSDSSSSTLKLKDGEYVKFVGVPSNQTTELAVVVMEFNDTYDQYTATVTAVSTTKPTIAKTNGSDGSTGVMTASTGSIETASFAVKTNDTAGQIITVNNDLTEISPTGVVLRIAPYALMLGAGVVLLVLSRRRKNRAEEA